MSDINSENGLSGFDDSQKNPKIKKITTNFLLTTYRMLEV